MAESAKNVPWYEELVDDTPAPEHDARPEGMVVGVSFRDPDNVELELFLFPAA